MKQPTARTGKASRLALLGIISLALGAAGYLLPPGFGQWRLESDVEFSPLGHPSSATAAAVSRTGELLASGDDDGSLKLWSSASGQLIGQLQFDLAIYQTLFLPGSRRLAIGLGDGRVMLWDGVAEVAADLPPGNLEAVPAAHLAASDDGHWLAAGDPSGRLRLWDLTRAGTPAASHALDSPITALAFSGDSSVLAVATLDHRIHRLTPSPATPPRLSPRRPPLNLPALGQVVALAYGRENLRGFALAADQLATWDLRDEVRYLTPPADSEAFVALFPESHGVALLDSAGTVFRGVDGQSGWASTSTPIHGLLASAWSADGQRLLATGVDGALRTWNADGSTKVRLYGAPPLTLATTSDGRLIATSHSSGMIGPGRIELWRGNGEHLGGVILPAPPPTCLEFSTNDQWLEAWHYRQHLGTWRVTPEKVLVGSDQPSTARRCRRSHDRRFFTSVIRQVIGPELVLEDAHSGWLTTLSDQYLLVADVARRTLSDRLLGRFVWVGLSQDRSLVVASAQPQWPVPLLLLAAVGWIPVWRLLTVLWHAIWR